MNSACFELATRLLHEIDDLSHEERIKLMVAIGIAGSETPLGTTEMLRAQLRAIREISQPMLQ